MNNIHTDFPSAPDFWINEYSAHIFEKSGKKKHIFARSHLRITNRKRSIAQSDHPPRPGRLQEYWEWSYGDAILHIPEAAARVHISKIFICLSKVGLRRAVVGWITYSGYHNTAASRADGFLFGLSFLHA